MRHGGSRSIHPAMDLNKLTQKSQEAVQEAVTLAARFGHQHADAEHLLAALLS